MLKSGYKNLRKLKFWIVPAFFLIFLGVINVLKITLTAELVQRWDYLIKLSEKASLVLLASFVMQLLFSMSERDESIEEVKKCIRDEFYDIRNGVIDGAKAYRLKRIVEKIEFQDIFKNCESGGEVGIFFSYHPELSNDDIYKTAGKRGVRTKLLLSSPDSPGIKFKFDLLGKEWRSNLEKLKIFINQNYKLIAEEVDSAFEMKLVDNCVDIPLVVIRDKKNKIVRVLSGFYSIRPAMEMPWLEWECCDCECRDNVARVLVNYFDARWEMARVLSR